MLRALVYLSHSTKPLDVSTLRAMAEAADARNRADGVTGILSHRNGVFMQYVEGPAPAVDDLWVRLLHDDRHRIIRWVDVVVDDRRFGAWGMRLLDPLWLPAMEPIDTLEELMALPLGDEIEEDVRAAVTSTVTRIANAS